MHRVIIKFLKKENIKILSRIAEHGCIFNCAINQNLEDLLCKQIGITTNYLKNRIKTIFLNGKVIDNYQKVIIYDQDKITLSAAMPGLVGAILRSKGNLSSMRHSISSRRTFNKKNELNKTKVMGSITLKLLNLVSKELSTSILNPDNIIINTTELIRLLKNIMIFYPNNIEIFFDKSRINDSFAFKKINIKYKISVLSLFFKC